MAKPLSWPAEYEADYKLFVVQFEAVRQITARLIRQNGESLPQIRRALPVLVQLGNMVSDHIRDLEARKRGRWPYKINDLIIEIDFTAANLTRYANFAIEFFANNHLSAVNVKIKIINEISFGMLKELARHRNDFNVYPDAVDQAAELIEQLTKDWK